MEALVCKLMHDRGFFFAPGGPRESDAVQREGAFPTSQQGGKSMLVLTRRVGEVIVIDHDIRITVVSVRGERVRIGISAPNYVQVDREEVYERRAESRAPT